MKLADIAAALGARAEGDVKLMVRGAAEPAEAGPDDLALAMNPKYAGGLAKGCAQAAVLWNGADWRALGLKAAIFVDHPRLAMSGITRTFDAGPDIAPGVHPTAIIDPSAVIGAQAAIGPFVIVGRGARIGARSRIAAHTFIGEDCQIGDHPFCARGRQDPDAISRRHAEPDQAVGDRADLVSELRVGDRLPTPTLVIG